MKTKSALLILAIIFCLNESLASSNWSQRADFGAEARHRATALSIGNKGYMGLGHYNGTGVNIVKNDWWEYDPSTNSWTQKADFTGNSGIGNYGVFTFSFESAGYVGGGQLGSGSEMIKYSPLTNSWTHLPNLPFSSSNLQAFTINEIGYYIASSNLYKFDEASETWSNLGNTPFSPSAWNATFSIDEKGYVKSGHNLYEYKPATNQWISRANFPGLASGGSASFSQNGHGYIVSGYGTSLSDVNSEVWEYSPFSDNWKQLPNFLGTSRRFSSFFKIDNRVFIGTGTNGTNFNDFWEFNSIASIPEENSPITINCYPNPAQYLVHFETNHQSNTSISIYSSVGRLITQFDMDSNSATFYRKSLPSGWYFYNLMVDNEIIYSGKFTFQ